MVALTPAAEIEWPVLEREVRERLRRRLRSTYHWHDVDDMTVRVLEAVWRRAETCRDVRGLAFTIARRRAIDVIRARRSARAIAPLDGADVASAEPAPIDRIAWLEERRAMSEHAARLPGLIAALPPVERRTIELHYDHGLSFNQIDGRLGMRKGSASAAHTRASVALRRALERGAACLAGAASLTLMALVVALPLLLTPATAAAAETARAHAMRSPFGTPQRCPLS